MTDISSRIQDLSPAKRRLLQSKLAGRSEAEPRLPEAPGAEPVGLRPRVLEGPAPLSFSQQSMFMVEGKQDLRAVDCVITAAVHLTGRVDEAALRGSFEAIVERHESLRTVFEHDGEGIVQVVRARIETELETEDLSHLPEADREQETRQRARQLAGEPFDVAKGPLFRGRLFRLGATESVLFFAVHHLVCDGWSARVLLGEMAEIYEAFVKGDPSPLAELPLRYRDYAVWQREAWRNGELEPHAEFWRRQLVSADGSLGMMPLIEGGDSQVVCCSGEGVDDANRLPPGQSFPFVLPGALRDAAAALARGKGVTLYTVLASAFDILLQRYSGQDDIAIGTTTANRSSAALEKLVGFLSNLIVIRTDLTGDPTVEELLQRSHQANTEARLHQEYPYALLLEDQQRSTGEPKPLFAALFILLPRLPTLRLAGLRVRRFDVDSGRAMYSLTLSFEETDSELLGRFEFDERIFDPETVSQMAEDYRAVLEAMVESPAMPISTLRLAGERPGLAEENLHGLTRREQRIAEQVALATLELNRRLGRDEPTTGRKTR